MTPDMGIPDAPVVVFTPPELPPAEPCAVCQVAPREGVSVVCAGCGEKLSR